MISATIIALAVIGQTAYHADTNVTRFVDPAGWCSGRQYGQLGSPVELAAYVASDGSVAVDMRVEAWHSLMLGTSEEYGLDTVHSFVWPINGGQATYWLPWDGIPTDPPPPDLAYHDCQIGFTLPPLTASRRLVGDSTADGLFDSSDLIEIFTAGKYEQPVAALWQEGDWTADGRFDTADLIAAMSTGAYEQPQAPAAVPEPLAWPMWLLALAVRGGLRYGR